MGDVEKLQFEWRKQKGFGGKKKDVRFFHSFYFDGVEYALYDSVYLFKDGEPEPHIGKIIKIWEHADKSKKVKILWYFRPCEILNFLGTEKPLQNELFLASGEGEGLANINPLEAIAGKCNVVCTSKDARNFQPLEEEIQSADFVFYRAFDVAKGTISEIFNEKIALIDIHNIFNGAADRNTSGVPKPDSEKKEGSEQPIIDLEKEEGSEQPKIDSGQKKVSENATILELDSQKKEFDECAVSNGELLAPAEQNKSEASIPIDKSNVVKHDDDDKNEAVPGNKKMSGNSKMLKQKSALGETYKSNVVKRVVKKKVLGNTTIVHLDSQKNEVDDRVVSDVELLAPTEQNKSEVSIPTDKSTVVKHDDDKNEAVPGNKKTTPNPKLFKHKSSLGEADKTSVVKRVDKNEAITGDKKLVPNLKLAKQKSSLGETDKSNVINRDDKNEAIPGDKTPPNSKEVKQKSSLGEKKPVSTSTVPEACETSKSNKAAEKISDSKAMEVDYNMNEDLAVKNIREDKVENKRAKDFEADSRLDKKGKPNGSDNKTQNTGKLNSDANGKKATDDLATASEGKSKLKRAKSSPGPDNVSKKKLKTDETIADLPDIMLPKSSSGKSVNEEIKTDSQTTEVSRKPDDERSKWFKGLPWEERLKNASEVGTLVLLQNLDPFCTSAEVEDIVWHAFKEKCSAKRVQKTALLGPHSGLAYIIPTSRAAAKKIVEKLDEGSLMMSNGRVLVASIQNLCFPGKQSTFCGHLVIDKLKFQLQRDMKEAVSTSHCSQPNTLEYDMAAEWCLLQDRSGENLKKLFERHGGELNKLKAKLKSK
ncbi:hypothetical protein ACFE04_017159 [Oxalis oulophora]